jgi:hypothetical protein
MYMAENGMVVIRSAGKETDRFLEGLEKISGSAKTKLEPEIIPEILKKGE